VNADVRVPGPAVALSTSSVYPERTPDAFEMAARLGYDGIEIMVYTDPVSQDAEVLRRLSDYHQVPVLSVHAPSLLLTQRVWGR
jgi:sugar phosphate isomerase/epimerase